MGKLILVEELMVVTNNPLLCILTTLTTPWINFLLRTLIENGFENLAVVCDSKSFSTKDLDIWKDRTGGKLDKEFTNDPYEFSSQGIPFFFVSSHNNDDCIKLISKLNPVILLNGGTPRKLNSNILNITPYGVINVHPGSLPNYRGACCVEWAILNKDPIGVTAHFMDEEYDHGPIIMIEYCTVNYDDDYEEIRSRVYKLLINVMVKAVHKVLFKVSKKEYRCGEEGSQIYKSLTPPQMENVRRMISDKTYFYSLAKKSELNPKT